MADYYEDLLAEEKAAEAEQTNINDEFGEGKWITASEMAAIFGVDPKTVGRWAKQGKLENIRVFKTPGGHRRYKLADIEKLVQANGN